MTVSVRVVVMLVGGLGTAARCVILSLLSFYPACCWSSLPRWVRCRRLSAYL